MSAAAVTPRRRGWGGGSLPPDPERPATGPRRPRTSRLAPGLSGGGFLPEQRPRTGGIEPPPENLEFPVLPLNYAPGVLYPPSGPSGAGDGRNRTSAGEFEVPRSATELRPRLLLVGPPGIEPGLHPPHGCELPGYSTDRRNSCFGPAALRERAPLPAPRGSAAAPLQPARRPLFPQILGPPGFEPGLLPPKGSELPGYSTDRPGFGPGFPEGRRRPRPPITAGQPRRLPGPGPPPPLPQPFPPAPRSAGIRTRASSSRRRRTTRLFYGPAGP